MLKYQTLHTKRRSGILIYTMIKIWYLTLWTSVFYQQPISCISRSWFVSRSEIGSLKKTLQNSFTTPNSHLDAFRCDYCLRINMNKQILICLRCHCLLTTPKYKIRVIGRMVEGQSCEYFYFFFFGWKTTGHWFLRLCSSGSGLVCSYILG